MDAIHQTSIDKYVKLYAKALAPYALSSSATLLLHCVAINGAGEALMREMLAGRIGAPTATNMLSTVICALATTPKAARGARHRSKIA